MTDRRTTGRSGRRRGGSPTLVTIWWRDIPAQLTARVGDSQHKLLLPARFQHAIDRAAGVAGLTATDDYVRQWRSEPGPLADGDPETLLEARCAAIDAAYPRRRLEALVTSGGAEDHGADSAETTP